MYRDHTKVVKIGNRVIGGGNPILIQSIPSPKAEPFKLWMAQVTRERLDEMQDPELTIDRAMMEYKRLGYSDN